MLDRILYRLASPLAREIIDSLRTDPGEWECDSIQPLIFGGSRAYRIWFPDTSYYKIRDENSTWRLERIASRLALRRAIKAWEKNDG